MLGLKKQSTQPFIYHTKDESTILKLSRELKKILVDPFVIVCIGTDRCIGDSLGPLVGHSLKRRNVPFPVYGTIDEPIHAVNLLENINYIKDHYLDHTILAIDASLGSKKSLMTLQLRQGPIYPGKGVGKELPPVGDYSLIGIVDTVSNFNVNNIHQVRLSLIMEMVDVISDAILDSYAERSWNTIVSRYDRDGRTESGAPTLI